MAAARTPLLSRGRAKKKDPVVDKWRKEYSRALIITAHPDDAEFLCGGTIALLCDIGLDVTLCVATSGDKGTRDVTIRRQELAAMREEETRAACRALGVRRCIFWGMPDGFLEEHHDVGVAPVATTTELLVDAIADLTMRRLARELDGATIIIMRTEETGGTDVELLVPAGGLLPLWERLMDAGRPFGITPIGTETREALRIEAGLPKAGADLTERRLRVRPLVRAPRLDAKRSACRRGVTPARKSWHGWTRTAASGGDWSACWSNRRPCLRQAPNSSAATGKSAGFRAQPTHRH